MAFAAGIGALLLAAIHFWADRIHFSKIPRSKWLSVAGGISVAFVFVHVLPELQEWQEAFAESATSKVASFFEPHLYLVALLGLTFFYGLERAAKTSKQSTRKTTNNEINPNVEIFWIHISSFAVYNFLIGYLLINREDNTFHRLLIFVTAMGFHFLVNDFGLLDHYEHTYQKKGRWVLAVSVILGWVVGSFTEIHNTYIGVMYAFIAGGVIMNVLKEELPEERKSKFQYFILGMVVYSALLLII
jgi:zinc transporter ZupT